MTDGARTLTAQRLWEVLSYDEATGVFTWRAVPGTSNRRVGKVAGTRHSSGYVHIQVDGVIYKAHRLAWLYVTGQFPNGVLDHDSGVRDGNAICNLADVNQTLNGQNRRRAQRNSQTGLLGASPHGDKFAAVIKTNGKQRHLGLFATAELAHAAYVEAKRRLHPGGRL